MLNTTTPGMVRAVINLPGLDGVSGEGAIAVLKFHVKGVPGSYTDLKLTEVMLGDIFPKAIPSAVAHPVRVTVIGESDPIVAVDVLSPLSISPDDRFMAHVSITQVSDLDVASFTMDFDSNVLQVWSVFPGSLSATATLIHNNADDGNLNIVINQPGIAGVIGAGIIATIEFRTIGAVGSASDLGLSTVLLGNSDAQPIRSQISLSGRVRIAADAPQSTMADSSR